MIKISGAFTLFFAANAALASTYEPVIITEAKCEVRTQTDSLLVKLDLSAFSLGVPTELVESLLLKKSESSKIAAQAFCDLSKSAIASEGFSYLIRESGQARDRLMGLSVDGHSIVLQTQN